MTELIKFLKEDLPNLGLGILIAIIILVAIYHWPKVNYFIESIAGYFSKNKSSNQDNRIKRILKKDINSTILELNSETPNLFTESIDIEFYDNDKVIGNNYNGKIFLKINRDIDRDQLFVNTVYHMIDKALLVNNREYFHSDTFTAIKLKITDYFVRASTFQSANLVYSEFRNNIIKKEKLIDQISKIEYIDDFGLFTRIFLNECNNIQIHTQSAHNKARIKWEIRNFLDFINNLLFSIEKEDTESVKFEFNERIIKLAVAILARESRWRSEGISFYQNRTLESVKKGARILYINAIGKVNISRALQLTKWLEIENIISEKNIMNYDMFYYNSKRPAICISCPINPVVETLQSYKRTNIQINNHDLEYAITTICDENFNIYKSAWIKDKIAIIILHNDSHMDPIGQFIGKGSKNLRKLQETFLHKEKITLVRWSSDISEMILHSLELDENQASIKIDPINNQGYIELLTDVDYCIPFSEMINILNSLFEINFEASINKKTKIRKFLSENYSDINEGRIEIIDIGLIPNELIKVLVTSKIIQNPAKNCYETSIKFNCSINNTRIVFCNHSDNERELIIDCLYPLHPNEVKTLTVNNSIVTIELYDWVEQPQRGRIIGSNGCNVITASQITGFQIRIN